MSPMTRLVAVLVTLVALAACAARPARAADTPDLWDALEVNRAIRPFDAPPFALPDLDGQRSGPEAFRGRVVLLYFWATW